jgi:hypothetical protein
MSPIAFAGDAEAAAADTNYPYAPAGEGYFLKVRNAKEQISKKSGRPMIALEYVIAEGEHEGLHVFNYLVFIEAEAKGHGMTIHALKAHGLPWEGDVEISASDFNDIMVKVDLGVEEYPVGSKKFKNVIKKFHLPPSDEEMGTAQETAHDPVVDMPLPEPAVSPKEQAFKEAAEKAGFKAKVAAKPAPAKAAVKKPLPWKKK